MVQDIWQIELFTAVATEQKRNRIGISDDVTHSAVSDIVFVSSGFHGGEEFIEFLFGSQKLTAQFFSTANCCYTLLTGKFFDMGSSFGNLSIRMRRRSDMY